MDCAGIKDAAAHNGTTPKHAERMIARQELLALAVDAPELEEMFSFELGDDPTYEPVDAS